MGEVYGLRQVISLLSIPAYHGDIHKDGRGRHMLSEMEQISERLERSALESLHEFCPVKARDALGLKLIRVEDVSVALSSTDPSMNSNDR